MRRRRVTKQRTYVVVCFVNNFVFVSVSDLPLYYRIYRLFYRGSKGSLQMKKKTEIGEAFK